MSLALPFIRTLLGPDWLLPFKLSIVGAPQPLDAPDGVESIDPADLVQHYPIAMTRTVHDIIRSSIGAAPAESGAMLGGPRGSDLVTHIHLDPTAATTRATYSPDVATANRVLAEEWRPAGIELMGFVHSHPSGYRQPSSGDIAYATRILDALPRIDRLYLPIVGSAADDGHFSIAGFTMTRGATTPTPGAILVVEGQVGAAATPAFRARVETAYDPAVMTTTRIVAVGVGGSVSYLEDMARSGVGEFVLIDPDVVEDVNVGTQHVWPDEIGRPKVAACARRLAALNPSARIWTVQAADHALDDRAMRRLVFSALPGAVDVPRTSLLCAFTDAFAAQARLARLGLHLGVPFLSAAVYQEGRGSEITFSAAGVTYACTRCASSRRYHAHLEGGYRNTVTSHGTPIYVTSRLNALKQVITQALLHGTSPEADPDHPATARYRRLLGLIGTRNLVITSHDPDIGDTLGLRRFATLAEASNGVCVTDETVWLDQVPDNPDNGFPTCPDCGGTGDLTDSIGAFSDTRAWRTENRRSS